jgi:hypothetical protein
VLLKQSIERGNVVFQGAIETADLASHLRLESLDLRALAGGAALT